MRGKIVLTLFAAVALGGSAAAAAPLPPVVGQLGLTDVQVYQKKKDHYGVVVKGVLPEGAHVELDLDRHDDVEDIEAEGRGGFSAKAVEALVPETVRASASYPADATFYRLELDHDDEIEIEGRLAGGGRFKAEFTRAGRLIEMKTD